MAIVEHYWSVAMDRRSETWTDAEFGDFNSALTVQRFLVHLLHPSSNWRLPNHNEYADYGSEFLADYLVCRLAVTLSWSARLQLLASTGWVFLWGALLRWMAAPVELLQDSRPASITWPVLCARIGSSWRGTRVLIGGVVVLLPASVGLLGSAVIVMSWGGNSGPADSYRPAVDPSYVMDGTVTFGITLIMKR